MLAVVLASCLPDAGEDRAFVKEATGSEDVEGTQLQLLFLNQQLREGTPNIMAYALRAKLHYEEGRQNQALRDIQAAIAMDSTDGALHYLKAQVLRARRDYAQAYASVWQALDIGFTELRVFPLAAELAYLEGRLLESVRHYETARLAFPRDSAVVFGLGKAYAALGDTAKARHCFEDAATVAPCFYENRLALAEVLASGNHHQAVLDRAMPFLDKCEAKGAELFTAVAKALEFTNRADSAVFWHNRALEADPGLWETAYTLASHHLARRNYVLAKGYLAQTVAQNPRFAKAHFELGMIAEYYLPDVEAAMQHYADAAALAPDDGMYKMALVRIARKAAPSG